MAARSVAPVDDLDISAASGRQRGPDGRVIAGTSAENVHGQEECALLHLALQLGGALAIHASGRKHRGHPACDVPCCFAEPGRQRARGHNAADAREHDRDRCDHQPAQFAEAGSRPGVLDLRAGRRVHLLSEGALFVVVPGDNRDAAARDAHRMQRARSGGCVPGAIEYREDDGMPFRHGDAILPSVLDAVVVGAGPSGCVAARNLARAGAKVAIVDGSHPREKACGGGVTARALSFVNGSTVSLTGHGIDRAVFEAGGRSVSVPIGSPDTLRIFDREAFDGALLRDAIGAGATHFAERVIRCERVGHGWTVATTARVLSGSWLLGADGACGVTRKTVATPFARSEISIATGAYVDGVSVREIVIAFTDAPSGYLWSFPRRDRLAVGACAQADAASPAAVHAVADAWLDGYAPADARPRRRYSWPIPSIPADAIPRQPTSGNGWLLVGDAAGLVDPITREGIYFALESGVHAGAALGSRDPVRTYDAQLRDGIHPELRRAARLKEAFFRPRFTRLLIDALGSSAAIRDVMIDLIAGRQPYATLKRRLLGTLEFGLMAKVLFNRGDSRRSDPRD